MNKNFKVSFFLRGDRKDELGRSPIQTMIQIGSDRLRLGATGLFVDENRWDATKYRAIGRNAETLRINNELEHIATDLRVIFRRYEFSEQLSLEKIKSEYLRPTTPDECLMPFYDKFIEDRKEEVGTKRKQTSVQKYEVVRRHFKAFLAEKYRRKDIKFVELDHNIIIGFEHYLFTVAKCQNNTVMRMLRTFKTVILLAMKTGLMKQDPFANYKIHFIPVNRGYLTDDEIMLMMQYEFSTKRLEQVRDTFVFQCFTGLAYIDVANLTKENIKEFDGQLWIMTRRQKTNVASNIPLLDVPAMLIKKYEGHVTGNRLMPILSNQKQNEYLHEIATLCGIEKNLTCHLARHTFATLALSKGVPVESVSKMLGHTNIRTTQIYAKITSAKVKSDMDKLATKLDKFSEVCFSEYNATASSSKSGKKRQQSHQSGGLMPVKSKKKRGRPRKNASDAQFAANEQSQTVESQITNDVIEPSTLNTTNAWGDYSFIYV